SVQGSLDQQLGKLLEQTVLADEVFGLLVVGQQARQQFFGYVVFLGVHCAYGQAGLRRRWIVRLHKILHTLPAPRRLSITASSQERPCAPARCRHKKTACKKVMPFFAIMRSSHLML